VRAGTKGGRLPEIVPRLIRPRQSGEPAIDEYGDVECSMGTIGVRGPAAHRVAVHQIDMAKQHQACIPTMRDVLPGGFPLGQLRTASPPMP
jgi:hypothetical protein